jgi:hypothetical protein
MLHSVPLKSRIPTQDLRQRMLYEEK